MEQINATRAQALKMLDDAYAASKKLINDLFPTKTGKVTDRVKTFDDACREIGVSADHPSLHTGSNDEKAYKKLKVIAQVLNEGWKPDWNNSAEIKYYPWFTMDDKRGFAYYVCDDVYSGTFVGSRLCFKSSELAEYAAKQFQPIYKDFFTA